MVHLEGKEGHPRGCLGKKELPFAESRAEMAHPDHSINSGDLCVLKRPHFGNIELGRNVPVIQASSSVVFKGYREVKSFAQIPTFSLLGLSRRCRMNQRNKLKKIILILRIRTVCSSKRTYASVFTFISL